MVQPNIHPRLLPDGKTVYFLSELAAIAKEQPEYTALLDSYQVFQADAQVQQALKDLRIRQKEIATEIDQAEFERLLERFYAYPIVAAYYQAEKDLQELVKEMDRVISEAAGLAFAANAKRSCCGG